MSLSNCHVAGKTIVTAILAAGVLTTLMTSVRAEVRVQGTTDAVEIEAKQASVSEIMSVLGASFDVRFRLTGRIDRLITGSYSGPLDKIIPLMLKSQHYGYIIKRSPRLEVTILGVTKGVDSAAQRGKAEDQAPQRKNPAMRKAREPRKLLPPM